MNRMCIGGMEASRISLGCMRIDKLSNKEAQALLNTALEKGINFFDHADVYASGESERVFSKAINMDRSLREKIFLQSKCGIRKDGIVRYDFSRDYILESVDGILKRLNTEYLDVLLLHRPDPLVEPEEVAEAFDRLHTAGKVRNFGVSNQSPMLMELLSRYVRQPLVINQLQFSIAHTRMMDYQIYFNTDNPEAVDRSSEILEYCRLKDITIQAWSPFQYGFFQGSFVDNPKFPKINEVLDRIAKEKNVSKSAVVVAWILRHPAKMQVIAGTTNPGRLSDICQGADVCISREEWYEIYSAMGRDIP